MFEVPDILAAGRLARQIAQYTRWFRGTLDDLIARPYPTSYKQAQSGDFNG